MAYNAVAAPQAIATVAAALGREDVNGAQAVFELAAALGAPVALRDIGMREEDLDQACALALLEQYQPTSAGRARHPATAGRCVPWTAAGLSRRQSVVGHADAELLRHQHQIGKRARLHLAHGLGAVDLDGDLTDAHLAGNLLVQQAGHRQAHDFGFTR